MMNFVAMFMLAGAIGLAGGAIGVYSLRRQAPINVERGKPRRTSAKRALR